MDDLKKSATLLRHELASIDMSDILELLNEKASNNEVREIAGTAEIFYRTIFEKRLKLLIQKQLEFMGKEASNEYQLHFARGTINGLMLIDEWFKDQVVLSLSRQGSNASKAEGEAIEPIGSIT